MNPWKKRVRLAEGEVEIGACVGMLCMSSMSGTSVLDMSMVFGGKNMVGLLLGRCLLLGVFGKCCC